MHQIDDLHTQAAHNEQERITPPLSALPVTALPGAPCLIVMIGMSGAGKSQVAARLAGDRPDAILSSHQLRALLSGDAHHPDARAAATALMLQLARERLLLGQRVIIDAMHLDVQRRREWLRLARELDVPAIAIWCATDPARCVVRAERARPLRVKTLRSWLRQLEPLPRHLDGEGWDAIWTLPDALADDPRVEITRPLTARPRKAGRHGVRHPAAALDIVGDVHGCHQELLTLMGALGWRLDDAGQWHHPEGRLLVFVGDLTDRGPASAPVLQLVVPLLESGRALLVRGNHDDKLLRHLDGKKVKVDGHIQTTLDELDALDEDTRRDLLPRVRRALRESPLYALFDPDPARAWTDHPERLVVAHAAFDEGALTGSLDTSGHLCLYGPTTGKRDADGFPERVDWLAERPEGARAVVFGHTPFTGPAVWQNEAMCVDTACVFGGRLSALRWPERQVVDTPALAVHSDNSHIHAHPRRVPAPPTTRDDEAIEALLERWATDGKV